ncbi:GumK N-terminal domain-containing glycosyltransferase [Palleronia sediminis]|uniref:GumK N-terminal domain-containing glycosyltransferase n=1 Tax=Palleronia sediminis TaxID=2547833 RepID=UPI0026D50A11
MTRIAILTGHLARQRRRASLNWVADALARQGHRVTLVTVGHSWISWLRRDPRLAGADAPPRSGPVAPNFDTVFARSPIHPFSTRSERLDALLRPAHSLFARFWAPRLRHILAHTDRVIVESGAPLVLVPTIRRVAPHAHITYRVNDDLRCLRAPGWLVRAEPALAAICDRVSTASPHLAARLPHRAVTLDPMDRPDPLPAPGPDPFAPRARIEAISAGTTQIDMAALAELATDRPDWRLHVVGRLRHGPPSLPPNIRLHGECGFDDTVRMIAHADVGLAPYLDRPGVAYQATNSNRVALYRHFGLPILAPPAVCHPAIPALMGWTDRAARDRCETRPRRPEILPRWADLAARLVQNGPTDPPEYAATPPEIALNRRSPTVPPFASTASGASPPAASATASSSHSRPAFEHL